MRVCKGGEGDYSSARREGRKKCIMSVEGEAPPAALTAVLLRYYVRQRLVAAGGETKEVGTHIENVDNSLL